MYALLLVALAGLLMGCGMKASPEWPVSKSPDLDKLAGYEWPDPDRYREEIEAFVAADAMEFPPEGAVLAIGSSSMRGWHGMIHEDLAPLTLIPRGFGGSTMYDVYTYLDQVVLPYRPRAILIYEGDNDIAAGVPPEAVFEAYQAIKHRVHAQDPSVRFYLLPAKPSPSRWDVWPQMQEANRMLAEDAAADPRVTFIDTASPMLGEDGRPKPEIFIEDELHMNRQGYELWRDAVRRVLVAAEQQFE